MLPNRKAAALALGLLVPLSAATVAQPQRGDGQTLVIDNATVEWFQESNVSALRPGVLDKIELRLGKEVMRDGEIGRLHKEVADLAVKEAEIQAKGQGAVLKSIAQKQLAAAVVMRNKALLKQGAGFVSREEIQKAEAEYAVADAGWIEASDTQELAKAKLESARRAADEHIIRAPFPGIVIEEFKHEGESVQANEPVCKVGNLDRVRVWTYIPVEYAYRVTVGTEIEIQPRLTPGGTRTGKHPIEQLKFRGAVMFVDPSIQPIGENGVLVKAEIDNPKHQLRPGIKATMTFFLRPETTTPLGSADDTDPAKVGSLPTLPPQ